MSLVLTAVLAACGQPAGPAAGPEPEPAGEPVPRTAGASTGAPPDDGSAAQQTPDDAFGHGEGRGEGDGRADGPSVVAVNAPITDLVRNVLGDRGEVATLLSDGADHHTYEPTPADAAALADADLFFGNGLDLDPDLVRLADANLPEEAPLVLLAEEAVPEDEVIRDDGHGHSHGEHAADHRHEANPHAWMSPAFAGAYVDAVADALADAHPEAAGTYREHAAAYREQLAAVDAAIAEAVDTIPEGNRRVVTFHDSWDYFLPRYGLELVAAVQPSDYSDPSAADVRSVIDQVREQDVPAVFGSEQFPSGVLDAISEETGADYVGDLSDEQLPGAPGDPEHSYLGLIVSAARTVVDALGGDAGALDAVDPAG